MSSQKWDSLGLVLIAGAIASSFMLGMLAEKDRQACREIVAESPAELGDANSWNPAMCDCEPCQCEICDGCCTNEVEATDEKDVVPPRDQND